CGAAKDGSRTNFWPSALSPLRGSSTLNGTLPRTGVASKVAKHSEWPTSSVEVNLARPFKGSYLFDSSTNYSQQPQSAKDKGQPVAERRSRRSTSCGAADSAKPKASLRALGRST